MATCDLGTLLNSASCLNCLDEHQQLSIQAYLLNQIAGTGLTPGGLLDAAKCFMCLNEKQNEAIQAYELCKINGG